MKTAWKDHFSGHAADYSAYRPGYPQALIDFLASIAPSTETVLDCGGQLSIPLASRFDRVIATDASPQKVSHAEPNPRVEYRTRAGGGERTTCCVRGSRDGRTGGALV